MPKSPLTIADLSPCSHDPKGLLTRNRDLCPSCYAKCYRLVRRKLTTWEALAARGIGKPVMTGDQLEKKRLKYRTPYQFHGG